MYLSYYDLKIEPFTINADPKFLWLGEKHQEALATLRYGVLANKGFLLLTGDVGTGKTTLINALVNSLGQDVISATVHDPGLELLDFFNFVARAFQIKKAFANKGAFLVYLSHFLRSVHDKNKRVLLIIDEAQRLSSGLLEEIRLLSNIEEAHTKLINIFLVGQNEFKEILLKNENRALRQRISLIHNLETLNEAEVQAYIRYRLQIAGSKRSIFDAGAVQEIYSFSGGYPRLINIICDFALLTGYVKDKKTLDARIIRECADELRVSRKSYEKENSPLKPEVAAAPKTGRSWRERLRRPKLAFGAVLALLLVAAAAGTFYHRSELVAPAISVKDHLRQFAGAFGKSDFLPADENRRAQDDPAAGPEPQASEREMKPPLPDLLPRPDDGSLKSQTEQSSTRTVRNTDAAAQMSAATAAPSGAKEPASQTVEPAPFKFPLLIFFDYNSHQLTDVAAAKLNRFVEDLGRRAYSKIVIRGYTDGIGQYAYNKRLSELRAYSVDRYLKEKGVNPLKLEVHGMGPEGPALSADSRQEGQLNRRVEVELY